VLPGVVSSDSTTAAVDPDAQCFTDKSLTVCGMLLLFICCTWQVVDLIMQTCLSELDDAAVQLDPLIKLPCGHIFTTSTLDGTWC
jgi:hypothetical protein